MNTRVLLAVVALAALVGGLGWLATRQHGGETAIAATPPNRPAPADGPVIVVDAEAVPQRDLPDADAFLAAPQQTTDALGAAGHFVATGPAGRCVAATRWADLEALDAKAKTLSSRSLAFPALMLAHTTAEHLAQREMGYLSAATMSAEHRRLWEALLRGAGALDESGRVRSSGSPTPTPAIGIWGSLQVYIRADLGDQSVFLKLRNSSEPPSLAAIEAEPLQGSVLWWTWAYTNQPWSDQPVDVPGEVYTLGELMLELSLSTGLELTVHESQAERQAFIAAQRAPVAGVLWAIETAMGVYVEIGAGAGPEAKVHMWRRRDDAPQGLCCLPEGGYFSALRTEAGRALHYRFGAIPDSVTWVGWRVSEMPLLYRSIVAEEWEKHAAKQDGPAHPLDPEHTYLIWVKSVQVIPEVRFAGGGSGSQYELPAL